MTKDGENGSGEQEIKTPHIIISFNPKTYQVNIAGRSPNLEFAKYMLTVALEVTERQIRERDSSQIVRPEIVTEFGNLRG